MIRRFSIVSVCLGARHCAFSTCTASGSVHAPGTNSPPVIALPRGAGVHITPSAWKTPARRKRVARQSPEMLLICCVNLASYNDRRYQFRQENNLITSQSDQNRATLVLLPGNARCRVLFLPRRNAASERGPTHVQREKRQSLRIGESGKPESSCLVNGSAHEAYQPKPENILMSSGDRERRRLKTSMRGSEQSSLVYLLLSPEGESREYRQEQRFARPGQRVGFTIRALSPILLRCAWQIAMDFSIQMRSISAIEAHQRAQAFASQAMGIGSGWQVTHQATQRDNCYPDIVVVDRTLRPCITRVSGPVKSGDLCDGRGRRVRPLLCRMWTRYVSGHAASHPEQQSLQIVYDARKPARSDQTRATLSQSQRRDRSDQGRLVTSGLIRIELRMEYRIWFMHGTSHWWMNCMTSRRALFQPAWSLPMTGNLHSARPAGQLAEDTDYENHRAVRRRFEK